MARIGKSKTFIFNIDYNSKFGLEPDNRNGNAFEEMKTLETFLKMLSMIARKTKTKKYFCRFKKTRKINPWKNSGHWSGKGKIIKNYPLLLMRNQTERKL